MIRGQTVLTVTQVNVFIKARVEGDGRLAHCFLTGEISNLTDHYSSGHIYLNSTPKPEWAFWCGAGSRYTSPRDSTSSI